MPPVARKSASGNIPPDIPLDQAHNTMRALHTAVKNTEEARTCLYNKGWALPGEEISLETMARTLFAMIADTPKFPLAAINLILSVAYLITEQLDDGIKANTANAITKHLLDLLLPITTDIQNRLEKHLQAVSDSSKTQADLSDKLKETQEKLDETSKKIASNVKSYSQAAATPPPFPHPPTHQQPTTLTYAQIQICNCEKIKKRQVLIDFDRTNNLSLENLDERTLARKSKDSIATIWASAPEPKPQRPILKSSTLMRNGGLLLELDSSESSDWLREDSTHKRLLANLGSGANIKDRTYQTILSFVPIQFDPADDDHLRQLEESSNITPYLILKAEWIKPIKDRKEEQQVATLRLYHQDTKLANKILCEGVHLFGKCITPKKPKKEPIRCLFCQKFGHERRNCKADHPRCGRCTEAHETKMCDAPRGAMKCANCLGPHPSYERSCHNFQDKCQQTDARRPENNLAFYPTDEAWTWLTIDQNTCVDPPPP